MKKFMFVVAAVALMATQAMAAPISVAAWTTLAVGDKEFTKVAHSGNLNGSEVEATQTGLNAYSLNLSNLSTVTTNFTLEFNIHVTSGTLTLDAYRASENDILGNTTAGTNVDVYGDAAHTNLLFSDTLFLTDSGPIHSGINLLDIWVVYTSYGVDGANNLSNITSDVTQAEPQATIPEPASLLMFAGLAAIGGLAYARRRKA